MLDDSENEERREAIARKMHVWASWRRGLNDAYISDMYYGQGTPVRPLDDVMRMPSPYDHPDPSRRVDNPLSLLAYSSGDNSVTDLNPEEFLSYGIPRVTLPPPNVEYQSVRSPSDHNHHPARIIKQRADDLVQKRSGFRGEKHQIPHYIAAPSTGKPHYFPEPPADYPNGLLSRDQPRRLPRTAIR